MNIEDELAELKATVRHLRDRQNIHDCIQRESGAFDRQDVEMIASGWWDGKREESSSF